MWLAALQLDGMQLALATVAIFAGAFVRGYTGFGSSLVWVSSLTLFLPAAEVVPVLLALEVLASAQLLPAAFGAVDWRGMWSLMLGALAATPLGVWVLATVPAAPMRAAVSLAVVASAVLLWRSRGLARAPGRAATLATGAVSGLLNGSMSIGGPPIVLFYLATPVGMHVARASFIAYFLFLDAAGCAIAFASGLVSTATVLRTAAFVPAMAVGAWLGGRRFLHASPEGFRRATLGLLAALGLVGLVRALA